MTESLPELFSAFQCTNCAATQTNWYTSSRSEHPFGTPGGRLTCLGCRTVFPVRNGYLDLHPGSPEPVPPIQALMECAPIVDFIYEDLWRPLGYFIASKHSFPKD